MLDNSSVPGLMEAFVLLMPASSALIRINRFIEGERASVDGSTNFEGRREQAQVCILNCLLDVGRMIGVDLSVALGKMQEHGKAASWRRREPVIRSMYNSLAVALREFEYLVTVGTLPKVGGRSTLYLRHFLHLI